MPRSILTVLQIGWISPLQSRVALDTVIVTERLSIGGTVNIGNELGGRSGEFLHELVPVWLELLAVSTPEWRKRVIVNR